MKILVCTDGSEQSQKALEVSSIIATGCNADEVAIIHIYKKPDHLNFGGGSIVANQMEDLQKITEEQKKQGEKVLTQAEKFLQEKNIKSNTILKEGNPADRIVNVAQEKGFDMIVVGNRGIGGLPKILLGSVSNAVIQEAQNCSVLVVK